MVQSRALPLALEEQTPVSKLAKRALDLAVCCSSVLEFGCVQLLSQFRPQDAVVRLGIHAVHNPVLVVEVQEMVVDL